MTTKVQEEKLPCASSVNSPSCSYQSFFPSTSRIPASLDVKLPSDSSPQFKNGWLTFVGTAQYCGRAAFLEPDESKLVGSHPVHVDRAIEIPIQI
jgi:hypothetical protein